MQPAGRQQALHNSNMPSTQRSPAEQPVLFARRDHPQGALEAVRVNQCVRVIQVYRQADPALTDVREPSKQGAARQESVLVDLPVDPHKGAFEDRF